MAQIKIELLAPPVDGMDIKFKAPCNCTAVTGILVSYPDGEQAFTFRDSHCNNLAGIGNLFSSGAYVKAILDTNNGYAYLQNADTNGYLENMMGGELLWENAKPNSTFAAQTISIGLSNYEAVAIECKFSTDTSGKKLYFGLVGTTLNMDVISQSGYVGVRSATISKTGIEFRAATYNNNENVVGYIIPVRIFGIKGVFE